MALTVETELMALDDLRVHALIVRSLDENTIAYLNHRGLDGNGDTWAGIVDSIARAEMANDYSSLSWSPEADSLMVSSADRRVLERLQSAVVRYVADDTLMTTAIENADPEMMD